MGGSFLIRGKEGGGVPFAHDAQCVMCVIFDVIWILSHAGVVYPCEWIFPQHLGIFLVFYRE